MTSWAFKSTSPHARGKSFMSGWFTRRLCVLSCRPGTIVMGVLFVSINLFLYFRQPTTTVTSTFDLVDQQAAAARTKPIWTWQRYQSKWYSKQHPSLLIGHYSSSDDGDKYRVMMKEGVKASYAYCRRWKCDVVTLEGTLFGHPTHNKVGLLEMAHGQGYDRLLLLDADCVLVNQTADVAQLIPPSYMVMAHQIWGNLSFEPWDTNIGVTLWNLRHRSLSQFATRWRKRCETDTSNNDQWHYHILIQGKEGEWDGFFETQLATTEDYFKLEQGTVVKHFLRAQGDVWGPPAQDRLDKIRAEVALVCQNNTYC